MKRIPIETIEEAIHVPRELWAHQCHKISLAIVQAGLVPGGRIARGTCQGVFGQHSWIIDGPRCYALDADIIDPTLWSYRPDVDGIWYGTYRDGLHRPHGWGNIWMDGGKPTRGDGEDIPFPRDGLSSEAIAFLDLVEPLDHQGWCSLFTNPVGGWPAAELISRAYETPGFSACPPIDLVGMLTEHNPDGLYMAEEVP